MELNKETPLCKLAYKYGTDKCPKIRHLYTLAYYELLKDKRESIKKVLEMGIGCYKTMHHLKGFEGYRTGASLYMWRDFFPNAQIYGADNYQRTIFEDKRIKTFLCDETKKEDLQNLISKVGNDVDLFIDDGSHKAEDQIFMCKTLMPFFQKKVLYIIEDIVDEKKIVNALSEYKRDIIRIYSERKNFYPNDNEVLITVQKK